MIYLVFATLAFYVHVQYLAAVGFVYCPVGNMGWGFVIIQNFDSLPAFSEICV